jgi:hypothetical protein
MNTHMLSTLLTSIYDLTSKKKIELENGMREKEKEMIQILL